jgi:hypothetical protein
MPNSNTRAWFVDQTSGKAEPIQIDGHADIRGHFPDTDVKGQTLRELTDGVYLRKWSACERVERPEIAIYDAYDGQTLKPVDLTDLPISARKGMEVLM